MYFLVTDNLSLLYQGCKFPLKAAALMVKIVNHQALDGRSLENPQAWRRTQGLNLSTVVANLAAQNYSSANR